MDKTRQPKIARRHLAALAVLLAPWLALSLLGPSAQAAETTTRILRVPLELSLTVPCANEGNGEVVDLSGTIMEVFHVTQDNAGVFHIHDLEVQPSVSGVGETTGDRYVFTRVNVLTLSPSSGSPPLTSTAQLISRLNGQGPGNESIIRIRNHSTINANGEITASFDVLSVECEATQP